MKKRITIISGLMSVLIIYAVYCFFINPYEKKNYLKKEISEYKGQGLIEDLSFRHLIFNEEGYKIIFDKFELKKSINKTIVLKNLPLGGQTGVYFSIFDAEPDFNSIATDRINDSLLIKVESEKDGTVLLLSEELNNLRWARMPYLVKEGYQLYSLNKSFFNAKKDTQYKITINYTPKTHYLANSKGCIILNKGGRI